MNDEIEVEVGLEEPAQGELNEDQEELAHLQ